MLKPIHLQYVILSSLLFMLIACETSRQDSSDSDTTDTTEVLNTQTSARTEESTKALLLQQSQAVVNAIDQKDWARLAGFVHPEHGLRISPYPYIDPSQHRQLSKAEVARLGDDSKPYFWGFQDGSGDSIKLNFADYYGKYLYNKSYITPDSVGYNNIVGGGNALYNSSEVYPGSVMLEFYIPGTNPDYGGMDWGSLILVFTQNGNDWYLRSLAHGQWTI